MTTQSNPKPIALMLLDRDGVINFDSPDYIKSAAEWQPIPGALLSIAELNAAGIHTALCSNQAGIGRGRLTASALAAIHVRLEQELASQNGHLDLWRYCPHLPEAECGCRKPASGMLDDCMREFGIPPSACAFVGDSLKDMQAAITSGCLPIFLRTIADAASAPDLEDKVRALGVTHIADSLAAAVATLKANGFRSSAW